MKLRRIKLGELSAQRIYVVALLAGLCVFALAALVTLGPFHIKNAISPYNHVDAQIPIGVATHIIQTHLPDTNWARAPLPDHFKYDQYNFSSYNLAFAAFWRVVMLSPQQAVVLFSSLCFAAYLALLTWVATRNDGFVAGVVVFCGLIVTPLLVQDSFYGRPETFFTLLTASVFILSGTKRFWLYLAGSALAGFAIACKISFAPFALAALASPLVTKGLRAWKVPALGLVAIVFGFIIGAPGVVVEPGSFLRGIEYLQNQYSSFHNPHGSPEAGFWPQLGHALSYYLATLHAPTLLLFASGTVALAWTTLRTRGDVRDQAGLRHMLVFATAAVLTIFLLSSQRTFFERNVSHAIAIAWLPVGWLASRIAKDVRRDAAAWAMRSGLAGLLLWSLLPMLGLSQTIAQVVVTPTDNLLIQAEGVIERRIPDDFPGAPVVLEFSYVGREAKDRLCRLLGEAKGETIVKLVTQRFPEDGPAVLDSRISLVVMAKGPFERIPVSTLHTYHAARVEFYQLRPRPPSRDDGCN